MGFKLSSGIFLLGVWVGGMGRVPSNETNFFLFPPPEKVSSSTLPHPKFSSPCQRLISPTKQQFPCYNPTKSFSFSWEHCSCIIFILNSYSLNRQVMLSLILVDVQYLQMLFLVLKNAWMVKIPPPQIPNTR